MCVLGSEVQRLVAEMYLVFTSVVEARMTERCFGLSETAAGRAALPVAEDSRAGPEREQGHPGEHQKQIHQTRPLPLPLSAGRQGVRQHHDTGEAPHPTGPK